MRNENGCAGIGLLLVRRKSAAVGDNAGLEAESDGRLISVEYMARTIAGEVGKELESVWSAGISVNNMLGEVASIMMDPNEQIIVC